ncbi:MAG: hypothetical protein U0441_10095 [Polyangiaceae bacterium]
MRNVLLGLAVFVVPFAMGCSAVSSPPGSDGATTGPVPTTTTPPPPPTTSSSTPTGQMCGGFGGFACPAGLTCIDDPRDSCDPDKGGADCSGICVPSPDAGSPGPDAGGPGCDKPGRKYMGRSADICSRIRYFCEPGTVAFHDDCGCGCESDPSVKPAH